MKQAFKNCIIAILLLAVIPAIAQDDVLKEKKRFEHFKERNISKTYPAAGNTLDIDNSFGDVIITTGGSEIKVDIHIEASATDKDLAEKVFNSIDVTDSKSGNIVKFKTSTNMNEKKNDFSCHNCGTSMTINYSIQLPAGTPLIVENSFGKITIPDYSGSVNLTSKFGSLTTGNLAKTEAINVEFGKADIKSTGNASYTFKFSTVNIGNLDGAVKLNMEFCKPSRIYLSSGLSSLNVKESYSTVNLRPAAGLSASYDVRTSFGSFKNKTGTEIRRTDEPDRYGPDADKHYEGKSGAGSTKVDIKSSFGNIILGEATDEDMQAKNKGKSRVI